jgi:hypothetical protein
MQESYGEGVASHTGPESCGAARKGRGEALTGERAGRAIEPRKHDPVLGRVLQGADAVEVGGRLHGSHRQREMRHAPARSETHGMSGHLSHGNREVPRSSAPVQADRIAKSKDARR